MDKRILAIALGVFIMVSVAVSNADESSVMKLVSTLFPVPAPTGYEESLVQVIQGLLPADAQTKRDNLGSFYWKRGKQESHVAVCTPMDEPGYFVSGIDPEGYLRIDKPVFGPPLIDSYHLGHAMIVWTENGPVEGVLALPSLHILSPEVRQTFHEKPGLELAYLDIGVDSEDEARKKGVALLDAVTPWRELTRLAGGKIAGHSLGLKICAALVLDVARLVAAVSTASNPTFTWMAQTRLLLRRSRPRSALGSFRAAAEIEAKNVVVVDVFPCDGQDQEGIAVGKGPILVYPGNQETKIQDRIRRLARDNGLPLQVVQDYSAPVMNPFLAEHDEVIGLFLPVLYSQTPSEVVDIKDAETLSSLLSAVLGKGGM